MFMESSEIAFVVVLAASTLLSVIVAVILWRRYKKLRARDKLDFFVKLNEHRIKTDKSQQNFPVLKAMFNQVIPFKLPTLQPSRDNRQDDVEEMTEMTTIERVAAKQTSLGGLDPSLYPAVSEPAADDDYPAFHLGRVWFTVQYERDSERLHVCLERIRNLPETRASRLGHSDTFVTLYLIPDDRRSLQSHTKKRTRNPDFGENFIFHVPSKSLNERTLRLSVFEVDKHRRHLVVGHALYSLRDHSWSDESVRAWRDLELEPNLSASDRGFLKISLSYNNSLERLTVSVFEAKDISLDVDKPATSTEFYVKVALTVQNKAVKVKKTDTQPGAQHMAFAESFNMRLAVDALDRASLTLSLQQKVYGGRDKVTGRVTLGSFMFARGNELQHWAEVCARPKQTISRWHALS